MAGRNIHSASAYYGILQGLEQKKVFDPTTGECVPAMNLVKYNSANSGRAIPAVLHSYAQVSTEQLLEIDRDTDPSTITKELLSEMPQTSMGYALAKKPEFRSILIRTALALISQPLNIFKYHSLWTFVVNKKFLGPLKIPKISFLLHPVKN